ncbi:ribosome recycling factor [Orrella sp. 11846]|uniref:ribosome recycling factor n=1 Tax=Orrella sp. 11846 TaxID=3409913 RepID=UPI003B5AB3E5
MPINEIINSSETRMKKSIENLQGNLMKIRTGRPSPALLEHIEVEYYGTMTPLNQVANITLLDSRTLGVQVWEKQMVQLVDKAIRESDLGLNPQAMGESIRVPMPALTEERRRDLTRLVRQEGEDAKVAVRNLRRDANDGFKRLVKDKEISEDDERRAQDSIQKLTDQFVQKIDQLIAEKETDIMTV